METSLLSTSVGWKLRINDLKGLFEVKYSTEPICQGTFDHLTHGALNVRENLSTVPCSF